MKSTIDKCQNQKNKFMSKTIKSSFTVAAVLIALGGVAGNSNNTNNSAEKIIQTKIHIGQTVYGTDNKVEILFTTNEKGEVNFALAKTENKNLKKEIEKQFQTLHFTQLKKDAVNSVILNFKTN
jgi:hypothetical protein